MPKCLLPIIIFILFLTSCTAAKDSVRAEYLQCVPYARDVSGITIYGDAHTWWNKALENNYKRGKKPEYGAVLVLSKTNRLEYGHVAVVKRIVSNRDIIVSHANWGNDFLGRGIIYESMAVRDVSPNNDWSLVKFWYPPAETFSSIDYKVSGFIYNKRTI